MRQRVALPKEEKNERLFRLEDRACPSEQGMLRRCFARVQIFAAICSATLASSNSIQVSSAKIRSK